MRVSKNISVWRLGRLIVALGLFSATSFADTVFTVGLDSTSLVGLPGTAVTFSGTILNASGVELFLNGAGGGLSSSELTLDLTPFFTLTPLSLLDGESYPGDIFSVASAMWLFPTTILEHLPYKGEWIRGPSIPWGRQISRSRLQTLRQFQN